MGFAARVGWHLRLALRLSRWAIPLAFAMGVVVRLGLPVEDGWIAGAVAGGAALLALLILALGSRGTTAELPPPTREEALETARGPDYLANSLARAALVLGSFTLGLAAGSLVDGAV